MANPLLALRNLLFLFQKKKKKRETFCSTTHPFRLWMAPEVLSGKEVDEKADVYSFGLVLWEIVTGMELFPEMESYSQFKRAICIEDYRPNIPPKNKQGQPIVTSLQDLMRKCWDKNPKARPAFKGKLLFSILVLGFSFHKSIITYIHHTQLFSKCFTLSFRQKWTRLHQLFRQYCSRLCCQ